MIMNVRAFLLDHLLRALRAGAADSRFVSGQQPLYVVAGALRPASELAFSAAVVQALHELCLQEAQLTDLAQKGDATYSTSFEGTGVLPCEFRSQGNTRALSLRREIGDHASVRQKQKRNSPLTTNTASASPDDI